jgi:cystinosin
MKALDSHALSVASAVVGWLYFVAWSASFYPQAFLNWKRKSVVGLSMDYLDYNILGFVCYSIYNCTLFFDAAVQERYEETVGSVIPVEPSDVVFALHAVVLTLFQIGQCFFYDRYAFSRGGTTPPPPPPPSHSCSVCVCVCVSLARFDLTTTSFPLRLSVSSPHTLLRRGTQYVSIPAMTLSGAAWLSVYVTLIVTSCGVISTLSWIYFLSFIKLGVTIIKYCPQAYLNFRRKSTAGWNIWNCLLDITGGVLSLAQQFMEAVNYGTWTVVYGSRLEMRARQREKDESSREREFKSSRERGDDEDDEKRSLLCLE